MAVASRRAVLAVRALPDIAALRKGKHLRSVARDAEVPFVAHSFASIYLLVVVYISRSTSSAPSAPSSTPSRASSVWCSRSPR